MWIIIYSTLNVYIHYVVRLFFGLVVGFFDSTSRIYIDKNCLPHLRGIFGGFYIASLYLGKVVEFLLVGFLTYKWVAVINGEISFVAILSTLLLREPAHFLILKGDLAKAEHNKF